MPKIYLKLRVMRLDMYLDMHLRFLLLMHLDFELIASQRIGLQVGRPSTLLHSSLILEASAY